MFKIGDKVRCIKPRDGLDERTIYTVKETFIGNDGSLLVKLQNLLAPYYQYRFEYTDQDYASITPTIRKIRELTARYNIKQQAKRAAI